MLDVFLYYALTLILSIFLLDYLLKDSRRHELAKKFNGPFRLPVIGNVLLFFDKKPEQIFAMSTELFRKYGKTVRIWVGPSFAIVTSDPKYFELVLNSPKHIRKTHVYDYMISWLGEGLLLSTGKKWHIRRKIITPTFHFKILEQFVEVFDRQSNTFVEQMMTKANGVPFDIIPSVTLLALDVLSETAMGTPINAQNDENTEYVEAVKKISYIVSARVVKMWQRVGFIFNLTQAKRTYDKCIKILHDFTTDIIIKRRESLMKVSPDENENFDTEDIGMKKKMALLDVLLQSNIDGVPLTNRQIKDEVDTFLFEGHDTTTSTVSLALYQLSQNPKIQDKVLNEIREVYKDDEPLTYQKLQEFKYLELVIKETLRMYPPVPIIARKLESELDLGDGRIVPANSNFNMSIIDAHMNSEYFKDPKEFIPERYSSENMDGTENPYIYVPFSAGPRNCIGQKFAMQEIKTTIMKVVKNFELLPSDKVPVLRFQLTLKTNGVNVGFRVRSENLPERS